MHRLTFHFTLAIDIFRPRCNLDMPMADISPLFSSKRYRKKRRTIGDKEKTNAYMKEYRKKGPDRNRKNITMLT